MRKIIIILTLLICSAFIQHISGKTNVKDGEPYLEVRLAKNQFFSGERSIYEVVLFTPDPNIAAVERVASPVFDGLSVSPSSADRNLSKVTIKGRPYYSAVIDRFFLAMEETGKFSVKGGDYRLGLNREIIVQDPFWGAIPTNRMEVINLVAPDIDFKVNPLPEKGKTDLFSGAVGVFTIDARLSEGEVTAGNDAILIVTISGIGDLSDVSVTPFSKVFPAELEFKSMTETDSHYIKDGRLGSEKEIECIFHPLKEGKFIIDNIPFTFFNERTLRYETILAPPIEVEVNSGIPGKGVKPKILTV